MTKKFSLWLAALFVLLLQSCSVNTETTYYKDSATSMESNILVDQSTLSMLSMMGDTPEVIKKNAGSEFKNLTTDWKSLYDIQKTGKVVLNPDSSKVLKKVFMKLNKADGEVLGVSLKYDKLMPKEIMSLFAQNSHLRKMPMQDFANWNGNKLTIDTEKFNIAEALQEIQKVKPESKTDKPKTKKDSIEAYGRQMASGMIGLMKMFNMNLTNTLKFQKPIKSIEGKHDFVEQVDQHTIKVNVRTADLWDEGKNLKNKDKKIIVTTE